MDGQGQYFQLLFGIKVVMWHGNKNMWSYCERFTQWGKVDGEGEGEIHYT